MQQQIPVSQQIQQLTQQLNQAFIQKEEAQAKIVESDKAIVAIRNVLAGVGLGQQLASEISAAQSAPETNSPE